MYNLLFQNMQTHTLMRAKSDYSCYELNINLEKLHLISPSESK